MDILTKVIIHGYILYACQKYGVDPNFAKAVAHIESRKGQEEFRIGRLGHSRYFGPFGIEQSFLKRWPIDDYLTNIEIGCRALRGPQERVLRRYNTSYSPDYAKAVRMAQREYQRQWP